MFCIIIYILHNLFYLSIIFQPNYKIFIILYNNEFLIYVSDTLHKKSQHEIRPLYRYILHIGISYNHYVILSLIALYIPNSRNNRSL